ncbi:MAG TPA: hypothetical protein VMQ11_13950 [Alphaproteobacteria bacterium]|nr:hypothetical protein [Alphaproteobacteria bacterium]
MEGLPARAALLICNFAGLIDNANPAHPRLISIFPTPRPPKNVPYGDFCDKGGRFGGYVYMNDDKWGLFVLRYTGKEPKTAAK